MYCDSEKLEYNWYNWTVARSVPNLDKFRDDGILWTKVLGKVKKDGIILRKNGTPLLNPTYHLKMHCILCDKPIIFSSNNGIISDDCFLIDNDMSSLPHILLSNGFILEQSKNTSWRSMLDDIFLICDGIAKKFRLSTDEERIELAHEALLQVIGKLNRNKLVYIPGYAPVFNLLTTTIMRCMFSIMNKRRSQKNGMEKLLELAQSGSLPNNMRSFKACLSNQY